MSRAPSSPTAAVRALALALMLASGFAALGLQLVWTQQATLWLGHETPAVLAVVAAFFGGLALGAAFLAPWLQRRMSAAVAYGLCEAATASWSLLLAWALPLSSGWLMSAIGPTPHPAWQWTVAFGGTLLLLLPATAAMGATLPLMERVLATLLGPGLRSAGAPAEPANTRPRTALAWLYAGNTAGAVAGVLATAFWLLPSFGLMRTALICAVLDLVCALIAATALARAARAPRALEDDSARAEPAGATPTAPGHGGLGQQQRLHLAATGLLGIGYEVLVVRVLSQVTENTVYTFAMLLAVYLVGTAAGAAAYSLWQGRRAMSGHESGNDSDSADAMRIRDALLLALAAACLAGLGALWLAPAAKALVATALGPTLAAALAAEAALALLAFGLPTLVMGALFSHLCTMALGAGLSFHRALAINTLGAALAPGLLGVGALVLLGSQGALLGVVFGYLLLSGWRGAGRTPPLRWTRLALGASAAAVALAAPPLRLLSVPEGGRVISHREGPSATVSVVEDTRGEAVLRINNRQQEGSNATWVGDARQAWLPLLLHPAPRNVLLLGLGTGVTASAAAGDTQARVQVVELLPEVVDASAHFTADHARAAARLQVSTADARRFVRAAQGRYDLIVSDNFHPARSGSAALYTVEHFAAVRERLAPGGLFCQWLPLHQLDLVSLRHIIRAFHAVYPDGVVALATLSLGTPTLGLLARDGGTRFDPAQVRQRLAASAGPSPPAGLGLDDEWAVLGSVVAGPQALARFAGTATANTDDHPIVAWRAPALTYAANSTPAERLLALLAELQAPQATPATQALQALNPARGIEPNTENPPWLDTPSATEAARLAAYGQARNRFLAAGVGVRPERDVHRMLAQVQAPLLAALADSPDFQPAYDPLLRMALALVQEDAQAGRALLQRLNQLQPARSEAGEALRQLGP